VGLGDFGGAAGTPVMVGGALSGTDLRSEHPISIVYDPVAEPNLHPVSNTLGGSQTILDVLEDGKVECSSCHDVHNSPNEVFDLYLLRDTQIGSQLCLDCHNF
jgi:predicted CXXCH cytochrome family protein